MGFKENLKQELIYTGMLKKELAALSGVHKRAIDTYLRTRASMPPADIAVKLAKALGVTVEYLVTGEDTSISKDINKLTRTILNLGERDRLLISVLVNAKTNKNEARLHVENAEMEKQTVSAKHCVKTSLLMLFSEHCSLLFPLFFVNSLT
jgi:transcriptional regulator with XRE-family HTH domain